MKEHFKSRVLLGVSCGSSSNVFAEMKDNFNRHNV